MRIGTAFAQQLAIDGIGERQARLLEGQEQLSSGKRISRPSDDPLAAAEAEVDLGNPMCCERNKNCRLKLLNSMRSLSVTMIWPPAPAPIPSSGRW
jgi:flagellar hook-associated protein 3 FlgL